MDLARMGNLIYV
ncbi:hypothetical protein F383_13724 [Gossypium arboreum]|uniref:Uncharacterized protein n=1 Tax=Gossypium arboreum TaxID=29729 RepID=A0A0B0PYD5_GOSAR|nr:hypothetical protein F383_13724 [Gossypium arboreum]